MGFDIHILGTSSARPTGLRQVSGSVVVCDEGVAIVDAGEGFQSRFAVQNPIHGSCFLSSVAVVGL